MNNLNSKTRIVAFDYLRTFVIILVLVHHVVLAYTTYAYINPENPVATFSPVVDTQKWSGFDLVPFINDVYFMPLLFFVSGLFVWGSLKRKGTETFLRDRLIRLGLPFVLGVPLIIPLAYFPAQLQVVQTYGGSPSFIDFWFDQILVGFRTAGPLWFLWLLLTFNVLVAVMFRVAPGLGGIIRTRASPIFNRPLVFFGGLLGLSMVAYLPLLLIFGMDHWTTVGPFHFQTSRVLLYLVYFLMGTAVSVYGLEKTMFNPKSTLTRHWGGWIGAGLMSLVVYVVILVGILTGLIGPSGMFFYGLAFTVTCAAVVFGVIAFFLRFMKRRVGIIDSLSNNAFGIYITHYLFMTWLQFWLLGAQLPVILKSSIVFLGTLILSWGFTAVIRRNKIVARVI